jgi:hypothetical protein
MLSCSIYFNLSLQLLTAEKVYDVITIRVAAHRFSEFLQSATNRLQSTFTPYLHLMLA